MKILKRMSAFLCAVLLITSAISVFADAPTVTEISESGSAEIGIGAEVPSNWKVTLPAKVLLVKQEDDTYKGMFDKIVSGDLSSDKKILVNPASTSITISDTNGGKSDVTGTLTDEMTSFIYTDLSETGRTCTVTSPALSAGSWSGVVSYNISLKKLFNILLAAPGLYDADGTLLAEITKEEIEKSNIVGTCLSESNEAYKNAVYAVVPNGVTTINAKAFANCQNLVSIKLPEGIKTLENGAFSNCKSLTSINIPESVTGISMNVFYYCTSLTSITIPEGVTQLYSGTFSNCGITSIDLPDTITGISSAFSSSAITSITIPESITSIPSQAFRGCKNLTSITIPNSVTTIGDEAFQGCKSLTNITLPDTVTSIGDNAFYYCTSLTSIVIPNGVTTIGTRTFENCQSLTSITLPDSLTSIGYLAFRDCILKADITYKGITYTSKNDLVQALEANGVTVDEDAFYNAFWK